MTVRSHDGTAVWVLPSDGDLGEAKAQPGVAHKAAGREKLKEAETLEKVETQVQVEDLDKDAILVVICAAKERMGGAMTTINSVRSNTEANVVFYIVTLRDSVSYTRYDTETLPPLLHTPH